LPSVSLLPDRLSFLGFDNMITPNPSDFLPHYNL
jgi:hypothetical protein